MSLANNIRIAKELAKASQLSAAVSSPAPRPSSSRYALPCTNLGKPTGNELACSSCPGAVRNKELECPLHGICVPATSYTSCPDYAAFSEITTRHLLYHIYPVSGNGVWQRNVAMLRDRLPLFNGRRLVAVAFDPPDGRGSDPHGPGGPDHYRYFAPTDSLDTVRTAFGRDADSIEFISVANDPNLREVTSFLPLFSAVENTHPAHAVFYGQAKGVTRPLNHPAHRWTEVLHHLYLDRWDLVSAQLRRHAATGAFKKIGMGWDASQSPSKWHYSGSWMWVRSDALYSRKWRNIRQWWGGIESYLSEHFTARETGCLFMERPVKKLNLYDWNFWRNEVEPALRKFDASKPEASRLLNLGCGPYPATGWLNVDVVREGRTQPDVIATAGEPLPFPNGYFERAYLGHVLEHVPWAEVPRVLADVRRVVKAGGSVCVLGPDSKLVLDAWKRGATDDKMVWDILEDADHHQYEALDRQWDAARHHWNATASRVASAMVAAGFSDVHEVPISSLQEWPVVDRAGQYQSAIVGTA